MSYTTQEINATVEKIVRTSIRRQYGALGNRRTDFTFNDLQDAAAGVFIIKPKAPFYVAKLSADKLVAYLETTINQVSYLIELVEGTGRYVNNIENISSLANARSALVALESATSNRTYSFSRVEDIPAFQRFDANIQRFLNESSKNIRSGGDLVRTPDEARKLLGSAFTQLETYHTEVVRKTTLLAGAMEDYNSMSLPQTLAGNIISNSRSLLDDKYEELSFLTPKQRLEKLREVTLDILATRATVRGFGSLNAPTLFYILDGEANVYADATYQALPANISSEYYGPYPITDTQYELRFTAEGDVITLPVQGSFVPKFESVITETYDIGDPNTGGITNDKLRLSLFNYAGYGVTTTWDITFSTNASKPIWEVVAEINNVVDPTANPLIAEPYLQPQKWSGPVDITEPGVTYDVDFTSTNPSLDFLDLNGAGLAIVVGDRLIVRDGTSSYDEHIVEVKAVSSSKIEGDFLHPAVPATGSETDKQIEVGEALALRLRITKEADDNGYIGAVDYQYEALRDRLMILVPRTGPLGEDVQYNAATTLGLFPGMEVRAILTSAKDASSSLTKSVLNNTYSGGAATPRVGVSAEFEALYFTGSGRTNPNNFLQVVCFKFQGIGDVTGGTSVTFTVDGAQTAGVLIGDSIALRTSSYVGEANTYGLVTSVSDTSIGATMYSAITADTGVQVEVGPRLDVATIGHDATIIVSGNTGNEGTYGVVTDYANLYGHLELKIDSAFPFPNGAGNAPIEFEVQVGRYKTVFSSVDETLASYLTVDDQATNDVFERFFDTTSGFSRSQAGTTPFVKLPEWPTGLEEGDFFERYDVPGVSAYSIPIVSLSQSLGVIELELPLSTDTAPLPMGVDAPYPLVRLRRHSFNNYAALSDNLNFWLESDEASSTYFDNLRSLINPLVVNTNPTISQVNAARQELLNLGTSFSTLGGYLEAYVSDVVEEIDTLTQSFIEKGADRAVDILLESRFSDFFGLDHDDVSYAGAMQKSIRTVQREDLPVRKDNRLNYRQPEESIIASYDDKDFEFARDELDNDIELDLPGGST